MTATVHPLSFHLTSCDRSLSWVLRFFGGVTLMVVPPLRAQEKQLSFLQRRRTASALSRDPRAPPGARPRSRACRRLRGTPSTLDKVRDSSERRARRASRRPLCRGARARAPAVLGTFPCSSVRNATAARGGQAGSITAPAAHFAIGSREFLAASERPFTRRAPRDSPRHSARALRGAGRPLSWLLGRYRGHGGRRRRLERLPEVRDRVRRQTFLGVEGRN